MWLRDRQGTEPLTARSPLGARRTLSLVALLVGVLATVFFVTRAMITGADVWVWEAVIAAVVTVIAAVDLAVIRHRRSRDQHGHGS